MVLSLKKALPFLLSALLAARAAAEDAPPVLSAERSDWTAVLDGEAVCRPQRTSYGFAVLTDGRSVTACTETGKILWQRGVPGRPDPYLAVLENDFILTVSGGRTLRLMNPDGLVLWSRTVPFRITDNPRAGRDGRIFVRGEKSAACYGMNGVCKWTLETETQDALPLTELNDGTLLVFLKKTADGKSEAVRVTPFGAVTERITFSGRVVCAVSVKDGVLLSFSGGGAGLCAAEGSRTVTRWVIPSGDPVFAGGAEAVRAVRLGEDGGRAALILQTADAPKAVVLRTADGGIQAAFPVPEISGATVAAGSDADGGAVFLSGRTDAVLYGADGKRLWHARLPSGRKRAQAWNFISFTDENRVILFGAAWTVTAFRTVQKPAADGRKKPAPSDYGGFYAAALQAGGLSFAEKITENVTNSARAAELKGGLYGEREREWAAWLLYAGRAYIRSLRQAASVGRAGDTSMFREDSAGAEAMIAQLPLFGTDTFQELLADMISGEKDGHRRRLLLKAAAECAFDPDLKLLGAIRNAVPAIPAGDAASLMTVCDAVYEICRFTGRAAFFAGGMEILTALSFPQYDSRVRLYARETLEKIAALSR